MNELQKKIQEWGNKTVALYNQIALNPVNKALYHVYTQSDLTQVESNPHVSIMVDKYKWNKGGAWIATKHFSQFSNNMDSAVQEVLSIYRDLTNN